MFVAVDVNCFFSLGFSNAAQHRWVGAQRSYVQFQEFYRRAKTKSRFVQALAGDRNIKLQSDLRLVVFCRAHVTEYKYS